MSLERRHARGQHNTVRQFVTSVYVTSVYVLRFHLLGYLFGFGPHRMHRVQRCGLLLPMFCVSVSLLGHNCGISCAKLAKPSKPIEVLFGVWTRVVQ